MSEMKQVIVIRQDLHMSVCKTVEQGCHAGMGAYFDSMERWGPIAGGMIEPWRESRRMKICVFAHSEVQLLALVELCEKKNMGHYLVRERTDNTPTALGIGPDFSRHIDKLTWQLGLSDGD